jgi:hypothetical protein
MDKIRKLEKQRIRRNANIEEERKKAREYYKTPARQEYFKKWRKSPEGRLYKKKYILAKIYGITVEEYDKMVIKQKGLCAICGNPETAIQSGKIRELNVDHNHNTGEIRGLLCRNCNCALGLLDDDIDVLLKAVKYLNGE